MTRMEGCTRKPKLLFAQAVISVLIMGAILLGKRLANEEPSSLMMPGECGSWPTFRGIRLASMCNGRAEKAGWIETGLSHRSQHGFGDPLSQGPTHQSSHGSNQELNQGVKHSDKPSPRDAAASQASDWSERESIIGTEKQSSEPMRTNPTTALQFPLSQERLSEAAEGKAAQGLGSKQPVSDRRGRAELHVPAASLRGSQKELGEPPQNATGPLQIEPNEEAPEDPVSSGGLQKDREEAPQDDAAPENGLSREGAVSDEGRQLESVANVTASEEDLEEEFGCDRSSWMTDVCRLRGMIRIQTGSTEIDVYTRGEATLGPPLRVRPQPRKFDADMMAARITEFELVSRSKREPLGGPQCDHVSDVPGVLFSAGGWTGNAFHEFTDVLIPLFVSTERYRRKVRLFVSDTPEPWLKKYGRLLEIFTEFPVVNLAEGGVSWCLERLTVGLEIHGYLTVDPERMPGGVRLARMSEMFAELQGIVNDNRVDEDALVKRNQVSDNPLQNGAWQSEPDAGSSSQKVAAGVHETGLAGRRKLRMGIVQRHGSGRVIENHDRVAQIAEEEGFQVEALSFSYDSPSLEEVFRTVQGLDVLMGVHGAALTYFVFMRPGTALIQVVPWGVRQVAEVYDGMPARAHGLHYIAYEIEATESSLLDKHALDDPVMADTESVWRRGWADGDRLYLREQNIRLKEERVRRVFREARQTLLGIGGVTETAK